MGHEITFQEVTGGRSSDVKPIEINVAGATRVPHGIRTRLARSLAGDIESRQERRLIDPRTCTSSYAGNEEEEEEDGGGAGRRRI